MFQTHSSTIMNVFCVKTKRKLSILITHFIIDCLIVIQSVPQEDSVQDDNTSMIEKSNSKPQIKWSTALDTELMRIWYQSSQKLPLNNSELYKQFIQKYPNFSNVNSTYLRHRAKRLLMKALDGPTRGGNEEQQEHFRIQHEIALEYSKRVDKHDSDLINIWQESQGRRGSGRLLFERWSQLYPEYAGTRPDNLLKKAKNYATGISKRSFQRIPVDELDRIQGFTTGISHSSFTICGRSTDLRKNSRRQLIRRRFVWTEELEADLRKCVNSSPIMSGRAEKVHERWAKIHPEYAFLKPVYLLRHAWSQKYKQKYAQKRKDKLENDQFSQQIKLQLEHPTVPIIDKQSPEENPSSVDQTHPGHIVFHDFFHEDNNRISQSDSNRISADQSPNHLYSNLDLDLHL